MGLLCNMIIKVKVNPCAKERKILEQGKNYFKIYLKSAPEKNKANKELMEFLASEFKVKKNQIKIIKGEKNNIKFISINKNG